MVKKENALYCPSAWTSAANEFVGLIEQRFSKEEVKLVVEVGVHFGYSLFKFALQYPNATIVGFDCFGMHDSEDARRHLNTWLKEYDNIEFYEMMSDTGSEFMAKRNQKIDVIHIDADHGYDSVKNDFNHWSPLLAVGGVVLFHDIYSNPETVGKFFSELKGRTSVADRAGAGLGAWYKDAE